MPNGEGDSMKHYCPMCGEQWNEDVCESCGWREGKQPRYTEAPRRPQRKANITSLEQQEVWLVIQDGGIRGAFRCQSDAETEIAAIQHEHPDLRRSDFCVQVERIRPSSLTP
jgi:hypothetical protein